MMAQATTVFPKPWKRIVAIGKWPVFFALTAASLYVIFMGSLIFLLSRDLYLREIEDASSRNPRGDEVFAETDFHGGETHPWKTVVWLRRAGHLFSTTLLEANSFDVSVGMKWRDDDNLVLQLDFGCDGNHTAPVETVGPIHITYRFGDPGHTPKPGYESSRRRDLPRQPCD